MTRNPINVESLYTIDKNDMGAVSSHFLNSLNFQIKFMQEIHYSCYQQVWCGWDGRDDFKKKWLKNTVLRLY